jgi:hypothetical protein
LIIVFITPSITMLTTTDLNPARQPLTEHLLQPAQRAGTQRIELTATVIDQVLHAAAAAKARLQTRQHGRHRPIHAVERGDERHHLPRGKLADLAAAMDEECFHGGEDGAVVAEFMRLEVAAQRREEVRCW